MLTGQQEHAERTEMDINLGVIRGVRKEEQLIREDVLDKQTNKKRNISEGVRSLMPTTFRAFVVVTALATLMLDVPKAFAQSSGGSAPRHAGRARRESALVRDNGDMVERRSGRDLYELQRFHISEWTDLPESVEVTFYGSGAVLTGLSPTSYHYFRVRAVNTHGASDWSGDTFVPQTDTPRAWRDVPEPANVPATGRPTFSGTMEPGQALTADTSEISDENGLEGVYFHYQWISSDGTTNTDIAGATRQSYTITGDEAGDSFKVRVSFTDRHGFSESLTYDPLANVAATGAPTISGNLRVRQTLSADTSTIADENGTDNADFSFQWMAVDTTTEADVEIAGATSSIYRLADEYQDRPVKVRVSFTDDLSYEESLTSEATRPIEAVGRDRIGRPEARPDDPPTPTTVTATTTPIVVDSTEDDYFVLYATFAVGGETLERPVQVKLGEDGTTTLSENVEAAEVRTPASTTATTAELPDLTASARDVPDSHDGSTQFTFELRFSEEPFSSFSYRTLRDRAFTVEGGSVRNARRLDRPSNIRWEITVQPEGNGDVVITLPVTTNCAASGAVCTGDGRKLSNGLELVAGGPDS